MELFFKHVLVELFNCKKAETHTRRLQCGKGFK